MIRYVGLNNHSVQGSDLKELLTLLHRPSFDLRRSRHSTRHLLKRSNFKQSKSAFNRWFLADPLRFKLRKLRRREIYASPSSDIALSLFQRAISTSSQFSFLKGSSTSNCPKFGLPQLDPWFNKGLTQFCHRTVRSPPV
jgi:hypothetical protein